jgi:hypothetical protein
MIGKRVPSELELQAKLYTGIINEGIPCNMEFPVATRDCSVRGRFDIITWTSTGLPLVVVEVKREWNPRKHREQLSRYEDLFTFLHHNVDIKGKRPQRARPRVHMFAYDGVDSVSSMVRYIKSEYETVEGNLNGS